MSLFSLPHAKKRTLRSLLTACAGAAVLVELRDKEKKNLARLYQRLQSHNCIEDWCANNSADMKRMKEFRHSLPESINTYLRRHESQKLGTDLAVPLHQFREMMGHYQNAEKKFEKKLFMKSKELIFFQKPYVQN
jgi:hypothetical protein